MIVIEKLGQRERPARQYLLTQLERAPRAALSQAGADALADEAKHRTRKTRSPIRRAR